MRARMLFLAIAAATPATPALAQVQASERGSVSQVVDGTRISIDYGRPQARGRTIFPDVVRWDETWTPGANWATTFTTTKPVKVAGVAVPAGSYSVWFIPTTTTWTVGLHAEAKRFHTMAPARNAFAATIQSKPEPAPPTEVLTFDFPAVDRTGTTLRFRWGTQSLSLRIDVPPSLAAGTMTPSQAAPYVGDWRFIIYGEGSDSTVDKARVALEGGRLVVHPAIPDMDFALVPHPDTPGVFLPAFLEKGALVNVEANSLGRWTLKGERAVMFTVPNVGPGTWFRLVR